MILTDAQLLRFLPTIPTPEIWTDALDEAMERFAITTAPRMAAFLAQVTHESGEFRRMVENLNYSAARLMVVWPKRFPTVASAKPYERQPEKLANYVYANRLGNGDVASGDGWLFRGRGLIQLTGRGNYRSCGAALGLPLESEPERLETPEVAAFAAAQFWHSRGCNELADDTNTDNDDTDFVTITRLINGGVTGLDERRKYWARAKVALA